MNLNLTVMKTQFHVPLSIRKFRVYALSGIWIFGYMHFQAYEFSGIWDFGNMNFRVYETPPNKCWKVENICCEYQCCQTYGNLSRFTDSWRSIMKLRISLRIQELQRITTVFFIYVLKNLLGPSNAFCIQILCRIWLVNPWKIQCF